MLQTHPRGTESGIKRPTKSWKQWYSSVQGRDEAAHAAAKSRLKDPTRSRTYDVTAYNVFQIVVCTLTLVLPARLLLMYLAYIVALLCICIATAGTAQDDPRLLKGWRYACIWLARKSCRVVLFAQGFYYIKETGFRDPRARLVLPSTHIALFEAMYFLANGCGAVANSKLNQYFPLYSQIAKAFQLILVDRNSQSSCQSTEKAIRQRCTEPNYGPLLIFPEGTVTNGEEMVQFKLGPFTPGEPVQPVILKFPFKHYDPSFTEPTLGWLRFYTQFIQHMEVEYLPLYVPNEEEKRDAVMFSNNVSSLMSKKSGINLSPLNGDDLVAFWHGRFPIDLDVRDVYLLRKQLHASGSQLLTYSKIFADAAPDRSMFASGEALRVALGLPKTDNVTQHYFSDLQRRVDIFEFMAMMNDVSLKFTEEAVVDSAVAYLVPSAESSLTSVILFNKLKELDIDLLSTSDSLFKDMDKSGTGLACAHDIASCLRNRKPSKEMQLLKIGLLRKLWETVPGVTE